MSVHFNPTVHLHQLIGLNMDIGGRGDWTQWDLRFCENEGSKDLKSMKKGFNWIENQGEN